jgi:hypothetical protein
MQGVSTTWNLTIEAVGSLSRPTGLRKGIVAIIDEGAADYVLPRCEYQTSARNLQARNSTRTCVVNLSMSSAVGGCVRYSEPHNREWAGVLWKTRCGNRVPLDRGAQRLSRNSDKEMGKCNCVKV